ncbi:MAG: hypothetical protein QGI83_13805 [Candidatus Latescibacteria bacterium]|nr:hypothetical protein [Candidatus Latescibacterota bacterium]
MPSETPPTRPSTAGRDARTGFLQAHRALMEGLDPAGPPHAHMVLKAVQGIGEIGGNLGILDASFNPMTRAHERMIEEATSLLGLDEVLLLLSSANVDKAVFGADLGQRLAMLMAYAEEITATSVAGCSHARFVDKSEALGPLYPAETRLTFIIGSDTLVRLFDPKYYTDMPLELDRLFFRAGFVVAGRGNAGISEMQVLVDREASHSQAQKIRLISLDAASAAMSSTKVRERRARGQPISGLVPDAVERAIETMNLYRG